MFIRSIEPESPASLFPVEVGVIRVLETGWLVRLDLGVPEPDAAPLNFGRAGPCCGVLNSAGFGFTEGFGEERGADPEYDRSRLAE
jgi:hypothetical protein